MGVNLDKPQRWKADIAASVDLYNEWFLEFAPKTYREQRERSVQEVQIMLERSAYLRRLSTQALKNAPAMLAALRMCTAPPIARDRLVGLSRAPKNLVLNMELHHRFPPRMNEVILEQHLSTIVKTLSRLIDGDIFPWLEQNRAPAEEESHRAAMIVADRLCGMNANPIIRNAQEERQLRKVKDWLEVRGYRNVSGAVSFGDLRAGEFAFRSNVQGLREDGKSINIPVDVVVMPKDAQIGDLPLLIEAKSAGDFTNTNKRRKEEAVKIAQLRRRFGDKVRYILFLCGYFDSGYLGYEAAEGIDWVWEHRMEDMEALGL